MNNKLLSVFSFLACVNMVHAVSGGEDFDANETPYFAQTGLDTIVLRPTSQQAMTRTGSGYLAATQALEIDKIHPGIFGPFSEVWEPGPAQFEDNFVPNILTGQLFDAEENIGTSEGPTGALGLLSVYDNAVLTNSDVEESVTLQAPSEGDSALDNPTSKLYTMSLEALKLLGEDESSLF